LESISPAEFADRRARLLAFLASQERPAAAVLAANPEQQRSRDTDFPYRQHSDFYYLTGFNEPNALLLLRPDIAAKQHIFVQPSDPHAEVWHGRRLGVDAACEQLGVDQAYSYNDDLEQLTELLNGVETVFYLFDDTDLADLLQQFGSTMRRPKSGYHGAAQYSDLSGYMAQQRLFKSSAEITLMRQACQISAEAHKRVMKACKPGLYEYQLAAELHYHFAYHGAAGPAYGTIVGSGDNACILHYTENSACLTDGDLVLIDAGAEFRGYAGDITRTFPVNGRFSADQAALYEVVLEAQTAAFRQLRPGNTLEQAQQAAARAITEGLLALGILSGSLQHHIEQTSYRRFFIHGLGHWLGLDVHDVGTYEVQGSKRVLEPNMVLTVEPGIYIPRGLSDVDERWQGIGIRIEDDILITIDGHENLTAAVPKTIAEIEQWMRS
jgi:Xaa-Pro aminopeptidase